MCLSMDYTSLIAEIEAFVASTGLAETTIGGRAVKDSRFVARLRAGKAVTYRNVERLKEFMHCYSRSTNARTHNQ